MTERTHARRLRVAVFVCVAIWLVLLGRLAQFTLRPEPGLREKARAQLESREVLRAPRGEILDRHGRPLVTNLTTHSLWGNPAALGNLRLASRLIAAATGETPAAVATRLRALPPRYQCLAAELSHPEALDFGRPARFGMDLRVSQHRLYAEGALASHVLGMVGKDGQGLEGIELFFDRELAGEPGWELVAKDGAGGTYPAAGLPRQNPVPGDHLILTLDRDVQETAEMELARAVEETRAHAGSIVVVEPATGDILALANWPSYDPRSPGDYPLDARRNRAITDSYEPGSTMKLVVTSLALDHGLMRPEDTMYAEEGSYSLGRGKPLEDTHSYGWLTFRQAFAVSSNIFFYKLATLASPQDFYRQVRNFGFGAPTGIPLPGEVAGLVRSPESSRWSHRSQGTMAIGQEVAVTPLQLALAYAAVANHGVLMTPRLVKAVVDPRTGAIEERPPQPRRAVMTPQAAAVIASFMEGVVADGTGKEAAVPGVRVAGKTGTAQKAGPGGKGYIKGAYVGSFVGFAPAESPRFVTLVMLDEPHEGYYGGRVAAPAFRQLTARLMTLVPPDTPTSPDKEIAAVWEGSEPTKVETPAAPVAAAMVEAGKFPPGLDGAARALRRLKDVAKAGPAGEKPEASAAGDSSIAAAPDSSGAGQGVAVPDLGGLTLREARRLLMSRGFQGRFEGSGLVTAQFPPAGSQAPAGSIVAVRALPRSAG